MLKKMTKDGQHALDIVTWLEWADSDYIAARILLLNHLLVQGVSLSNTAIEKYLKAIYLFEDWVLPKGKKGHDVARLYQRLLDNGHRLHLNKEYLGLLMKAYRMRYPDELETGFNIVLNETKLLVELDTTVRRIRDRFSFQVNGQEPTTKFTTLIENKAGPLVRDNSAFGFADRASLFARNTHCQELRALGPNQFVVAIYQVESTEDDQKFDLVGLQPKTS